MSRNNGHQMATNSTPSNGVKLTRNRQSNPFALNNLDAKIWNPATQTYVGPQQYYKLKREDGIDLALLQANAWVDHPDFNGTMSDTEFLESVNLIPTPAELEQISLLEDDLIPTSGKLSDMADEFAKELEVLEPLADAMKKHGQLDTGDLGDFDDEQQFKTDQVISTGRVGYGTMHVDALVDVLVMKDKEITELKNRFESLASTNGKGEKALIEAYQKIQTAMYNLTGYEEELPF